MQSAVIKTWISRHTGVGMGSTTQWGRTEEAPTVTEVRNGCSNMEYALLQYNPVIYCRSLHVHRTEKWEQFIYQERSL